MRIRRGTLRKYSSGNGYSIIPLEVKAEENLRAKSLKAFWEKHKPKYAVRTSMSDYREQEWMTNIPLYNIDRIKEYLEQ